VTFFAYEPPVCLSQLEREKVRATLVYIQAGMNDDELVRHANRTIAEASDEAVHPLRRDCRL
jgi:hypothetical protein